MKLFVEAFIKFVSGLSLVMILLFIPAGTIKYYNGWLFIALLFLPMIFFGIYLYLKDPELLKKRLKTKETEEKQKLVIGLSALVFVVTFIVSGLDYRFSWTKVNDIVLIVASICLLLGYFIYMKVIRENAYLSRVVEVQKNQKVIDTGLYGFIRHPMYLATLLMFLAIPLVLGSYIGFMIMLIYPLAIVIRIKDEEEVLDKNLEGYLEYKEKVKYRLIPFIW